VKGGGIRRRQNAPSPPNPDPKPFEFDFAPTPASPRDGAMRWAGQEGVIGESVRARGKDVC
jgi:hypothetical protein